MWGGPGPGDYLQKCFDKLSTSGTIQGLFALSLSKGSSPPIQVTVR